MRLQDFFIIEASYPGNIGAMEVFKFYKIASPKQKAIFDDMLANNNYEDAWEYMQRVVGVRLHPMDGE